jgi:hypothetical protein
MKMLSERFLKVATRILAGDDSMLAAHELEEILVEDYLDEEALDALGEGLALYSPGGGLPYVDAPELRGLIRDALKHAHGSSCG